MAEFSAWAGQMAWNAVNNSLSMVGAILGAVMFLTMVLVGVRLVLRMLGVKM